MKKLEKHWLSLGVAALGISGLFTIILIVGRASNALKGRGAEDFFTNSLAVHVNLGILVWLLSIAVSHFNQNRKVNLSTFIAAMVGMMLITISPFIGHGVAYTNNYIPIFDNSLFKLGIALFLAAIAYESAMALFAKIEYAAKIAAFLLIISFFAFSLSYQLIEDKTSSHYLYEYMFWAGGHILQFAYVQIMLIAWLALSSKLNLKLAASQKTIYFIFTLPVIFVVVSSIYIYSAAKVESTAHVQMFTDVMIFGNALAAIPLGIIILVALLRKFSFNVFSMSLLFSIMMFGIGGALGGKAAQMVAHGDITTVIPAHYHFSTIAVTVALMGYIYARFPKIRSKAANIQIILYSIGQIIYFSGLAILGGHGAARKTPGLDLIQMDEASKKIVEHIMRSGGSLSLIGGIMFVVLVIMALKRAK